MRLFTRKRRVDAAEFCRGLYDLGPFAPESGWEEMWRVDAVPILDRLRAFDPTFREVEGVEFAAELLALRLEAMGAAWFHVADDRVALAQSDFTKGYLLTHGRGDIWERMRTYNRVAADAAAYGTDSHRGTGRALAAIINQAQARLFENAAEQACDPEAAARVANRVGTLGGWRSGPVPFRLALEMALRLGVEGGTVSWTPISAVIERYYGEYVRVIRGVRLAA